MSSTKRRCESITKACYYFLSKWTSYGLTFVLAHELYQTTKQEAKDILETSRETLDAAPADVKAEYEEIDRKRGDYDEASRHAAANGLPQPDSSGVELRTVDDLQTDLETHKVKRNMIMATNPGVVEQYEKRKRDVSNRGLFIPCVP